MKAQLLSIGNELLIGDTVNTNASWMASSLTHIGVSVDKVITIGDHYDIMLQALKQAVREADLVLITGGLGPTHDDLTKEVLVDLAQCGYRLDQRVLEFVREMFERRGLPFTASNHDQALIPEKAETLFNRLGTAPGIWLPIDESVVVALPGVPTEMKHLMKEHVIPRVSAMRGVQAYEVFYLHTFGIPESELSDRVIGKVDCWLHEGLSLAYLPGGGGVTLRISSVAATPDQAKEQAQPLLNHLRQQAHAYLFSEQPKATLATSLVELLTARQLTLATAESCTGGLLSAAITDIPGSSLIFPGGMVAYANQLKEQELEVPSQLLASYGAVSAPVAMAMARSAAKRYGADIGISTTGIAGPGGGTTEKPVGTIWIGFWSAEHHFATLARLFKDRDTNRTRSVSIALDIVRREVLGMEWLPFDMKREYE